MSRHRCSWARSGPRCSRRSPGASRKALPLHPECERSLTQIMEALGHRWASQMERRWRLEGGGRDLLDGGLHAAGRLRCDHGQGLCTRPRPREKAPARRTTRNRSESGPNLVVRESVDVSQSGGDPVPVDLTAAALRRRRVGCVQAAAERGLKLGHLGGDGGAIALPRESGGGAPGVWSCWANRCCCTLPMPSRSGRGHGPSVSSRTPS
jgi:hypothetical protein